MLDTNGIKNKVQSSYLWNFLCTERGKKPQIIIQNYDNMFSTVENKWDKVCCSL